MFRSLWCLGNADLLIGEQSPCQLQKKRWRGLRVSRLMTAFIRKCVTYSETALQPPPSKSLNVSDLMSRNVHDPFMFLYVHKIRRQEKKCVLSLYLPKIACVLVLFKWKVAIIQISWFTWNYFPELLERFKFTCSVNYRKNVTFLEWSTRTNSSKLTRNWPGLLIFTPLSEAHSSVYMCPWKVRIPLIWGLHHG